MFFGCSKKQTRKKLINNIINWFKMIISEHWIWMKKSEKPKINSFSSRRKNQNKQWEWKKNKPTTNKKHHHYCINQWCWNFFSSQSCFCCCSVHFRCCCCWFKFQNYNYNLNWPIFLILNLFTTSTTTISQSFDSLEIIFGGGCPFTFVTRKSNHSMFECFLHVYFLILPRSTNRIYICWYMIKMETKMKTHLTLHFAYCFFFDSLLVFYPISITWSYHIILFFSLTIYGWTYIPYTWIFFQTK